MYGNNPLKPSDFDPIDLGISLAINAGATTMACKNPTMRVGIPGLKALDNNMFGDMRFVGGVAAALAAHFMGDGQPAIRKYGHDASIGLLNSWVATEACRRSAEKQAKLSGDHYLGYDDEDSDDDLFDSDILGAEYEEADLNFAYGW